MLEFIHSIGSKVFNFFSTKLGNEGTKRQRDNLADDFSSDVSGAKRCRLDMEPDSSAGKSFPAVRTNFNDRYYYRVENMANSKTTSQTQRRAMSSGATYDPERYQVNSQRDSQLPSATSTTVNSRDLTSKPLHLQENITSRDCGIRGFNFSRASQEVENCSSFRFSTNPVDIKFQGSSQDSVSDRTSHDRVFSCNRQPTEKRSCTPKLNGADETKGRSVFSKILGGDLSRGIKCLNAHRRNKLAVKQCIRLNEKNLYQELLNRHLTHHAATPFLPAYSVDRHHQGASVRKEEKSAWEGASLFDRSALFASTRLGETTTDNIKRRLDVSTSLLSSAVLTGQSLPSVSLPSWRQTMAVRRQQSQADLPERTLQTLQQSRHQPMRAPPTDGVEKRSILHNNASTGSSSSSKKSSEQSDHRRSISESPITIGSTDYEAKRRTSKDSDVEVLDESPGVHDSSYKDRLFAKRSVMPEVFEKALNESRYAKKEFLLQVNAKTRTDFAKQDILEKETAVKYYREQREKNESQLVNKVQNLLRISERLPVPLEETFIEEPEQEIYELLDEEEEVEEPSKEFPELTEEQDSLVSRALIPRPADQILVEGFRLQIARKDLATLLGLNWLNDEVINFYLNLVMERSEKQGYPKVYAFSTFFYPKVKSDGHKGVRRWTKNIDLFSYRYILVPVHLGMHWCLAVVDFRKKQIRYYDSMGGDNEECLRTLRNYLTEECQAKRQTTFDWNGWQFFADKDIPQQMNGSDCGMFTCKFAEYISRDAAITFEQRHMPYFRRRMVYEILTKTLM